ncbi:MAG: NTP transferase domain-containing protein, partial [Candidatus Subteraquimicrobiales bacterium]|nr:NTP transferase domain-containing protein [Candidatus Subteraquimicrobiales bacterium]
MTKVTGIILAGGRSSRFGQDKCVLKIENKTIIETIVSKLSELCSEIILVTNTLKAHKKIWEGLASKYSHLP